MISLEGETGRILGMDYGDSRIGIAVSDPSGLTAQPLKVIKVKNGWKNTIPRIHRLLIEMDIKKIVIGYPLMLSGDRGERCEVTDRFIEALKEEIGDLEIIRWDERYTTVMANEVISIRNRRKGKTDIIAAALILRSYLDFCRK
jgi:putative holliday junction resolvase